MYVRQKWKKKEKKKVEKMKIIWEMIGFAVEWVGFYFTKMLTKGTLQHT